MSATVGPYDLRAEFESVMSVTPNLDIVVPGGNYAYDLAIQRAAGDVICGYVIEKPRGSSSIDLPTEFEFVVSYPPSMNGERIIVHGSAEPDELGSERREMVGPLAREAFALLSEKRSAQPSRESDWLHKD